MLQMRSIAAGFAAALVFAPQALAATLLVPSQYPTIQAAVNAAVSGDEIVVAPGVYPAGFNYNGKRLTVRSASGNSVTVIDVAATGGTAVTAQSAEPVGTRLQGLTIRGASSSAVVLRNAASLEISQCRIIDSSVSSNSVIPTFALRGGAGIFVDQASAFVSDTLFENLSVNRVSGLQDIAGDGAVCDSSVPVDALPTVAGGAISLINDAEAVIVNSTFRGCSVLHSYAFTTSLVSASGGAIDCSGSLLQLNNCAFSGCESTARRTTCYVNDPNSPSNALGQGSTRSEGGAVSLRDGSLGVVADCEFGVDSACRAVAQGARNRTSVAYREVVSLGGAISVGGGSRLQSQRNWFNGSNALAAMVTLWPQNTFTRLAQVLLQSEGGAIFVQGTATNQALQSTDDVFLSSSCIASATGAPVPYDWYLVTTALRGGHLLARPGPAQVTIDGASFATTSTGGAVEFVGGTAVALLNSTVRASGSNAIVCDNNAALISDSIIRDSGAAPIRSVNNQSGPSLVRNYMCQNTPNSVDGPWQNGGGNVFASTCVTNDCNGNGIEDSFEVGNGSVPDCNANGVPDSCDIASAASDDCDENEIPDECQYRATQVNSPALSPVQSGTTLTHSFQGLAFAGTDVVISVLANADLSSTTETIQVKSGATVLGTLFQTGGADCTPVTGELLVPRDTFNGLLTKGGTFSLQFVPSFAVTAGTCNPSSLVATVEYQPTVPGDCNGNSLPDICDILAGTEADTNGDFIPDSCQNLPACPADLNLDGQVGAQDISQLLAVWGSANAAADINDDGTVNAQDLGLLLAAWGACP